jgi:hypothetical protein
MSTAQTGGSGVYNFLHISNSARTASLGGKNISIYDNDLNSAIQNPALLNEQMNQKVLFNYVNYFAGINLGYAGYAFDFKTYGTVLTGIQYFNYGKFTSADETGIISGNFQAADYAFNIIWAKQLTNQLHAGINLKPVISNYEAYTSIGLVFDIGLSYINKEKEFTASITAVSIGSQLKPYIKGHYEPVSFDLQAGISKKLSHAPFRVHATAQHLNRWNLRYDVPQKVTTVSFAEETDTKPAELLAHFFDNALRHFIVGVELIPIKSFYASLGYNHQQKQEMKLITTGGLSGFSWGFGIKLKRYSVHYGRAIYHSAGASNHFSLLFDLNEFGKKKAVNSNSQKDIIKL